MNPQVFLLISKDPKIRQLLADAAPSQTSMHTAHTVSEGLRLWRETSPAVVLCEGTPPHDGARP